MYTIMKKQNNIKKIFILLMCAILSVGVFGCRNASSTSMSSETSNSPDTTSTLSTSNVSGENGNLGIFKVICLNAGKADAIILRTQNSTVLIDTGEDDEGSEIVSYLKQQNIDSIDYLIITHFDQDHVGGADTVLKKLTVKNVIQSDCPKVNDDYSQYIEILEKKKIIPVTLRETMKFTLDSVEYTIYPPQETTYAVKDSNNSSLVTSVVHGENSFLFTGDAENARIQEMIAQGNLAHTFLKVPYHGFYQTSLPDLFSLVAAKYAVITSSDKLTEDPSTVNLLESMGTKVYLTRKGEITVTSDGKNMIVTQ
ncbi:ComEC/Rec2 family competence protein [[Clostridium] fimetarium]|uniref:Metal-dependent hydrolase, beta-lactamase superfamily II n=1 Tax=[Clostridium] fimetarium TaxID=99656 RepID=A0A1I0R8X3_9FIRM|nr:MBL fold metallo-hydrolase [[Clostridium] fimetarium]SEW37251.1 Metal-dependent hydrolase, beta-lactamase superfamily II [[Clostridium] fimetarium]